MCVYKDENVLFGQTGIHSGILQERYLQEYISEFPEHSMLFSQWLLYKKYIDQSQMNIISGRMQKSNIAVTGVHKTITRNAKDTHGGAAPPPQPNALNQEPQQIDRYQVLSVLGQGGMGKVYKVFDPQTQKELALKVNFCGDASSKAAIRFRREAKTMTKLKHPGIVRAYDIGCENNQMFFTMDLVKGVSLKELQLSTPMTIKQSVNFIIKVCDIMDYAHRNGVVHRDLKPANIMVDNGKPIIMDFGLAKVEEASQKLSKTGVMMGTLRYMPPEQVEGRHSATTAQSDLYSIGAILYELLTRCPIFTVKSHLSLLNSILNVDPIALREINPKIPKELEDICLKAISKHKKHRYQSCKTFANDLRKFNGSSNSNTRRTNARTLAIKKRKRNNNKLFAIVGGVAMLLLLLIFMISGGNHQRDDHTTNHVAEQNIENKTAEKTEKKSQSKNTQENKPTTVEKVQNKSTDEQDTRKTKEVSPQQAQNKKNNEKPKHKKNKKQKPKEAPDFDWADAIVGFKVKAPALVPQAAGIFQIAKKEFVGFYPGRDNLLVLQGTRGRLDIVFNLNRVPEKLLLGLSHLSTRARNQNYSPVDIFVNNEVVEQNFNPGGASPHLNKFEITKHVKVGTNIVSIHSSPTATSNHWLYGFGIFLK